MRNFVNRRAAELKPSGIRKFFDIVSEMKGAISLGVGEPDFVTPWGIRDAAVRSLKRGYTQYTGNRGLTELRENICRYLEERFSVKYSPERTIVTVGASEAIDLVLRAVCDPGDEILVPSPCYVSYAPLVFMAGGTAVPLQCSAENEFIVTPELIKKAVTPKTKAIILAYPNNPTGAIMTKEQLEAIIPEIKKRDLLVISDEIYAELISDKMGLHVDPYMQRLVRRIKGDDRIILISDQFVCDGPVPKGYEEATDIHFDHAGEIAGSGLTLDIACSNFMVHTGCSVCDAFRFASFNPAAVTGLKKQGCIREGNYADLVMVDDKFNVKKVIFRGEKL